MSNIIGLARADASEMMKQFELDFSKASFNFTATISKWTRFGLISAFLIVDVAFIIAMMHVFLLLIVPAQTMTILEVMREESGHSNTPKRENKRIYSWSKPFAMIEIGCRMYHPGSHTRYFTKFG